MNQTNTNKDERIADNANNGEPDGESYRLTERGSAVVALLGLGSRCSDGGVMAHRLFDEIMATTDGGVDDANFLPKARQISLLLSGDDRDRFARDCLAYFCAKHEQRVGRAFVTNNEIETLRRWARDPSTFAPGSASHCELLRRAADVLEKTQSTE